MHLNLPILDKLGACQRILIAGMGGGFDVFCGLPIYFELQQLGKHVHLANFSFSFLADQHDDLRLSETLVGITADHRSWYPYFPELYLTQWFREVQHEEVTIWCFHKTGVRPCWRAIKPWSNTWGLTGSSWSTAAWTACCVAMNRSNRF
jgi:hypothetical protein